MNNHMITLNDMELGMVIEALMDEADYRRTLGPLFADDVRALEALMEKLEAHINYEEENHHARS